MNKSKQFLKCPKCKAENAIVYTNELKTKGVVTTIYRCINCDYQPTFEELTTNKED